MLDWVGERTGRYDEALRHAQFVDLHRDHAAGVYNLALQLVGHHEDARDIAQEVLLKAYEQLARPGPFNARAWLYRVTVNACFDHLRALRRKPVTDLEGQREPVAVVNEYEQAELQRQLGCALRRLPPAQRTALLLREIHGLPVDEVAYVLGVQTDSAAVTLSRARSSFRRRFLEAANGAALGTGEATDGGARPAGGGQRRRSAGRGTSAGLALGVGLGLPSLSLPALPLPAGLEASSLLPALAPAAVATGVTGGGVMAGAIGKIAAALSTKAAAVAVGASLVAGGVGGVYTAERTATSARHAGAVAQAPVKPSGADASGGRDAASPRPSRRSTAPASATTASPQPGVSPTVLPTVSATPQPLPSETTLGETGDDPVVDGDGSGIVGSPSPTPTPAVTPSAPAPDPTPSPSASPSAVASPSPSSSPSPSP